MDAGAWRAAIHGVQRVGQLGTTEHNTFSPHIDTYGITLAVTLTVFDSFKEVIYLFIFGCAGCLASHRLSLAAGRLGWRLLLVAVCWLFTEVASLNKHGL